MIDPVSRRTLPSVLLIDDDQVSREVAATVLTMGGFAVHTAESGDASLAMFASADFRPEVIVVDAQMPGLSGAALIAALRSRSAATVIAISGSNTPAEISAAADGFLLKPFDAGALKDALEKRQPRPAAETSGDPVLSPQTLAQFRNLMPESAIREIYTAVVADLGKRVETLQAAIAAGETAEISRIGHAIKGGCAMAGALQAAHLGAALEALPPHPPSLESRSNHLNNSARLLADLRVAARSLERMLDEELPA
ncbi:MAG: Hpt domain-containing response regulator [Terracidiphilus sp.]